MKIQLELDYHECQTELGDIEIPTAPEDLSGLLIKVFPDEVIRDDSDELQSTGNTQVHIGGSKDALYELGKYLISAAQINTPRDFYTHYEPPEVGGSIHLVLHQAGHTEFEKTIRVGDT